MYRRIYRQGDFDGSSPTEPAATQDLKRIFCSGPLSSSRSEDEEAVAASPANLVAFVATQLSLLVLAHSLQKMGTMRKVLLLAQPTIGLDSNILSRAVRIFPAVFSRGIRSSQFVCGMEIRGYPYQSRRFLAPNRVGNPIIAER